MAGGYVGGGYIDEESAIDMLESALAPCGYDITHKMHYKTIRDGISYGMSKPITLKGAVENRLNLGSTDVKTSALKFIRDPDYGWEKLEKFYDGNIELGVKTGFNFWDKHFQWKKNEFYSFTAPKGRGKTLLVTALQVIASICADWKWIIAAQENSVEDYKENLFRYLIHDDVNTVRKADPKKYMRVRRYINDHFIFIDVDTIEQALITAKYIGDNDDKESTYALFLDPINSFMAGYGYKGQVSYDNGAEIAKKLLDFSLTEFTVVITQHTIISKQRENNGVVSSVHAEGGWYLNKASYTCTINREQGSNESVFNIDNVRNRKTGGKETKLSNSFILEWSPYDINIRMEELGSDSQTNVLKNLQQKHRRHE